VVARADAAVGAAIARKLAKTARTFSSFVPCVPVFFERPVRGNDVTASSGRARRSLYCPAKESAGVDKALIVTGASRGIGAATARLAAASGWRVCVNYNRHAGEAEAVATAIVGAGGIAIAVKADMAREADIVAMLRAPIASSGRSAGSSTMPAPSAASIRSRTSSERMRALWDVNVVAYFTCAREAVRRMSTRRGGAAARSSMSARCPRTTAASAARPPRHDERCAQHLHLRPRQTGRPGRHPRERGHAGRHRHELQR
jgi:hypothetical protein